MGTSEFDASTALSGDGPVFGAVLDGRWDGHGGANGGFLLALATRAIGMVLPFPDPVVVSGFYLRPGLPGPAEIRTEVVRTGRTTGFGQASLYRYGKEVLRATAAYSNLEAASVISSGRGGPFYTRGGTGCSGGAGASAPTPGESRGRSGRLSGAGPSGG